VWPDLKKFIGVTGGFAAASVPKVRQVWKVYCSTDSQQHKVTHALGPSVAMQSPGYGCSECYIAVPYFNGDPNTDLKVVPVDGVTEYLDVHSNEPEEHVLSAVRTVHCIPVLSTHLCRSGSL
jgi:hypothetical protein